MAKKCRIMTRTQADKIFFNEPAAYRITQCYVQQKKQDPYPTLGFKIQRYKKYQEKIQRNPYGRFPDEREKNVEKRIMPLAVHFCKQLVIQLFYYLRQKRCILYFHQIHYCKNNYCLKTVVKYLHLPIQPSKNRMAILTPKFF